MKHPLFADRTSATLGRAYRQDRQRTVFGERIELRGAGHDLTSWDPLFKDDYGPAIINSLNEENQMQAMMTTEFTDESWVGRQKIVPVKVGRNWSVGSIGSRGALPQAGRGTYADFKIPIKDLYGRVSFERYVMEQSRSKKGSWAQIMPQEMEGLVEDMSFRRNVIGWLDGKGILAQVNGTHTGATTIEVEDPGNVAGSTMPNRYLFGDSNSGMFIAVLDGSTPTVIKGTATITDVNADGTDITVDTPITAADSDYIVIAQNATQNSYSKEPEGMLAMVDDGTYVATYHNLLRSTYPTMKAFVSTGVGALSLDAIQQNIDAVSIKVGKGVDLFACEHAVRRAYLALLEADRRYTGADLMRPDGGTKAAKKPSGKAITYGDIPIMVDRDCPYATLFGLNKATFVRYVEDEGSWAEEGGGTLKWVQGYDEYTAFYKIFENYHCNAPARNFRMEGITVNQLSVRAF